MSEPTRSIPARLPFQAHGWKIFAGGLVIIGLYLTSRYSYVLFHTLVELFSITIGWALFLIMWNARKWMDNRYLLVLGTALAVAGGLDLVHTLAYKGLNLFPGFDSNLPTQLWIAARYLQSLSMLFALLFLTARDQSAPIPGSDQEKPGRSFDAVVLVFYTIGMVGLLSLIFLRQFPVCYIEGQGLTPFKIISEYVISFILLVSLAGLWLKRLHFDRTLLHLLIAATGLTIVSELAFTFYVGVYDFSNLVGHYGRLAAFSLIYLAVIRSSLQRPYSTLFRNLNQKTAALQKSEAQYRLLVENANDIVYSMTLEGVFLYVSPTWTRLLGHSITEVINHRFAYFIYPDDLPALLDLFKKTIQSGENQTNIEYRVIHKDGSWRWHTSNTAVIKDAENKVVSFIGIARDISERKRAEEALHENEAKFRALFHNVPMSGVIYRLIRNDQNEIVDWELQDINTRGAADLKQSPPELIGKRATALFGTEVMQPYLDLCREVVAANQPRHIETYFAHNHKYYLSAVFSLGTDFYANVSIDITERKEAEQERDRLLSEIQHNAAELDAVFNALPYLVSLHGKNGKYLKVNPKIIDTFGFNPIEASREEIAQRLMAHFPDGQPLTPENMPSNRALVGEAVYGVEYIITDGEGHERTLLYNAIPWKVGGEMQGAVFAQEDITERKRAEEKIQAAQVELKHLLAEAKHSRQVLLNVIEDQKEAEDHVQQLNAELEQRVQDRTAQLNAVNQELEAFSYSVSHDLRAPLRALNGFSAALISDNQDKLDQQAQHYLSRIQEASKRMGELIEDLLNLSRITRREVNLGRVDLSRLARQIANELHAQSPERQVEFEISPDLVVRADPGLIKIAMENLLHNALKYSSKKEMALIQVGVLDPSGPEGRVFYVRDNGAGFDMAYAGKLFTPFQRLHGTLEFSGTGIGLTIVQRIISRHGGRIWAEAAVNQGATFYFTLGGE